MAGEPPGRVPVYTVPTPLLTATGGGGGGGGVCVGRVGGWEGWRGPADLSVLAEAGCMPQPVVDSAGGSVFPQPHRAEAERGRPVRVQNRFSDLESTEVDCSGVQVFPMTDDAAVQVFVETPRRRLSRRVFLNPEIQDTPRSIQDRQSDESVSDRESSTSIMGAKEVSGEDEFRDVDDEPTMAERAFPGLAMRVGFFSLDDVNVEDLFRRRACVMKSVPKFPRVSFRTVLRIAFREASSTDASRFDKFSRCEWLDLLEARSRCAEEASTTSRRRRRREVDVEEKRAAKALALVQIGKLSSARQAFEGADLAPGSDATLQKLRKPRQTAQLLRSNLFLKIYAIWCHQSSNWMKTFSCEHCSVRRPSGMTNEHLLPLLDSTHDANLLSCHPASSPSCVKGD